MSAQGLGLSALVGVAYSFASRVVRAACSAARSSEFGRSAAAGGFGGARCLLGLACLLLPVTAGAVFAVEAGAKKEAGTVPQIVAEVNGEQISREELAEECLRHYGNDVLENMINKRLIVQECQRRKITVSKEEVDEEIKRLAARFSLPLEQWFNLLKQERGIKPRQYASEIIWPMLALRKLAGSQLEVTAEELQAEFESHYGPAIRVRIITTDKLEEARWLQQQAAAEPARFGDLAKKYSKDSSASSKGLVQPIRRHLGPKEIEDAAFALQDNQVSPVLTVHKQYVILLREGEIPGSNHSLQQVREQLDMLIRDRKLRDVASEIYRKLRESSQTQNFFADPAQRQAMPGVVAVVNGSKITLRELADECIERNGEEVLEGTIHRHLIQQALKRAKLTVSEQDLDQEIRQAAANALPAKKDGTPDVEKWLEMATEKQGVSLEIYRRDTVWPSVALKKLVGDRVQVTKEDMEKGFEANYGAKVQCRAIVLPDVRLAQKVWEKARANPDPDFFGTLATQYSIEPSSRALEGKVPPIKKFGGQPVLEKEAFALRPGELSSIVQVADKYVILLCEGYTKPLDVDMEAVRELLHQDLFEKKQHVAMAQVFEQLKDQASTLNGLTGKSHEPKALSEDRVKQPAGRAAAASSPTTKEARLPGGIPLLRPAQR